MVNSVFSNSVGSNTVFLKSQKLANDILTRLYENVGEDFVTFNNLYAQGTLDVLRKVFDFDKYKSIVWRLHRSNDDVSDEYSKLVRMFSKSIEGLYKAVLSKQDCDTKIQQLESVIEQFKSKRPQTSSLNQSTNLEVVGLIKPEIKKYIALYGYPSNHIFDPEKLAKIVEELAVEEILNANV